MDAKQALQIEKAKRKAEHDKNKTILLYKDIEKIYYRSSMLCSQTFSGVAIRACAV